MIYLKETRINKALSDTGFCSRREADALVEAKRVTVNGVPAEMGQKVGPEDVLRVDGAIVDRKPPMVYIALNKPRGIECTTNTATPGNVVDFVNHRERIFPIGRLDKDSEGLLLLTNDGDIVNKILRARNNHEKEYIVTVNQDLTQAFLEGMAKGVPILDTVTRPCTVERLGKRTFRIILTQGLNRQIRRMSAHFGYKVVTLKRIRIMNIQLGSLPLGKTRELSPLEMQELYALLSDSRKTYDEE